MCKNYSIISYLWEAELKEDSVESRPWFCMWSYINFAHPWLYAIDFSLTPLHLGCRFLFLCLLVTPLATFWWYYLNVGFCSDVQVRLRQRLQTNLSNRRCTLCAMVKRHIGLKIPKLVARANVDAKRAFVCLWMGAHLHTCVWHKG